MVHAPAPRAARPPLRARPARIRPCAALLAAALALTACGDAGPSPWRFEIRADGRPTAARVSLRDADGRAVYPEEVHAYEDLLGEPYFYGDGSFALDTPASTLRVVVSKGFAYEIVEREVTRTRAPTRIDLARAFEVAARGYRSGDGHVHPYSAGVDYALTGADLVRQMKAENLHVASILAANGSGDTVYGGHLVTGEIAPESEPDHVFRVSEEYRARTFGHLSVYGVRQLSDPVFTGQPGTRYPHDHPPNHAALLEYRAQGAFASAAHLRMRVAGDGPFAPAGDPADARILECPADVALGSLRAIEVLGYAVWSALAVPVWERLLSSGFDVVITAGTDAFLGRRRQLRMGGARAFVAMDGAPFDYDHFVDQLARGRAFVSNGALLFLRVGGRRPGEAIELPPDAALEVDLEVTVESLFPWSHVEVRRMGGEPIYFQSDGARRQHFASRVTLDAPGWIYAHLDGPHAPGLGAGGFIRRPRQEAITNAVWVRRGDAPRRDPESLRYLVDWLEQDLADLDRRDNYGSPENRAEVRAVFEGALSVIRARLAESGGAP